MAVLPILRFGDPVLREKCRRIPSISKSIQNLINDMIETMEENYGAGLAAPQVGKVLRLIVVRTEEIEPFALINPEIVKKSGERVVDEGCLSFPGYRGEVKRAESVTVKGLDCEGKALRIKATDFLAQVLEHEIDHLNGVLYIDHLESEDKLYEVQPEEYSDLQVQ